MRIQEEPDRMILADAQPDSRHTVSPSSAPEAKGELSTLFRQSSHYVAGMAATLVLGVISFPIFTRMFTVADYGMIDLAQKILLLAAAVAKCGLQNSAIRFYDRKTFENDPAGKRSYYSTVFFGVAALGCLVTLPFVLLTLALSGPLANILMFASALISVRAVQSILWAFLRAEERTRTYNAVIVVMKATTIIAILLLVLAAGVSVRTYFLGIITVEFAVMVYTTFPLIRRGLLKIQAVRPKVLQASIAFGLPLVLQELFGIVLDSGDRVVVRHYLGADALGFYSVAYGISTYVNSFLIAPLGLAITPIYIRLWNEQGPAKTSEFLSSTLDLFLMTTAAVMAVVWVSSHDILLVLASPKYQGADRLMPAIIAGLLIYTAQIFTNAGLIIHKRTALLAGAIAISAALNIGLNILMVPRMGLLAAALVTFLSYAFCSILIATLSSRFLSLKVHVFRATRYLAAATAAVLLAAALDMRNPAANAVVKTATALAAYIGILSVIDPRVRTWAAILWRRLRARDGGGIPVAAAASDPINTRTNINLPAKGGRHHILFMFDQLNNLNGGAERSLLKLIRSLPRDRFRISVATFCAPPDRTALKPLNCPVHCLPISKCVSAQGLSVALKLRRIIREEHVSIVQTFFASSDLWGSVIARLSGCSIIISSRRDMGFQLTLKQKIAYRLLSPVFDRVHTVSDAVRQFTIREDRIDPRKVITIPNGVRMPPPIRPVERDLVRMRYQISPGAKLVVDVGNIRPVRGFDVLVRAAAIVCRTHPNTVFLIVGYSKDSEYTRQIMDLAASLGLAENVRFAGVESDPIQILQAADLFCHLSHTDGLSNALLEAMSAELPSVITDVGGNPEVVKEGWNGFIVQPADHETAAERIRLLLENPEMARRMGEHGRQMIEERFTERHMAEAFIAVYDELLGSKFVRSA